MLIEIDFERDYHHVSMESRLLNVPYAKARKRAVLCMCGMGIVDGAGLIFFVGCSLFL